MRINVILALSIAAVTAFGAAGCGGSSSQSSSLSSSSTTHAAAASTPATSSAASTSTSSSTTAVTPPGTKLTVGKTALLAYKPSSDFSNSPAKDRLEITVTSITKGTLSDFNGIQLDATEKASTPYYVKARIKNVGPGDVTAKSNDPSVVVQGLDKTGQTQQSVTFIGDFPKCDAVSPPKSMTSGRSFDTCLTFLVPGGITGAAYTGTSDYISSPVTWR